MVLSASPVWAADVTLPDVLQGALRHHPDLVSVEREYADTLADALDTTTTQNPDVKLDTKKGTNGGDDSTSFELTQPLKVSSFSSRPAYAAALREQASAEQKAAVFSVLNSVTAHYAGAWILQERQQYLRSLIEKAKAATAVARKASDKGELPASELSLLEAQNAELDQQILRLQSDFEAATATLERVTNIPSIQRVTRPDFVAIPKDSKAILDAASRNTNARSVIQSQLSAANARLNAAQEDAAYPEFAPRLLWDRNLDQRQDELGIGIVVKIPLWSRNEAEVSRARAQQAASRSALSRLNLDQQLITKHKRAVFMAEQERAYQQIVLPKYQRSYDLTEKMFRSGQTSLLTVWQIQREMLITQEKALELMSDAITARLDLEAAMGGKIEEIQ